MRQPWASWVGPLGSEGNGLDIGDITTHYSMAELRELADAVERIADDKSGKIPAVGLPRHGLNCRLKRRDVRPRHAPVGHRAARGGRLGPRGLFAAASASSRAFPQASVAVRALDAAAVFGAVRSWLHFLKRHYLRAQPLPLLES